ncbi:MAG: 2-amino-4-hydroxy-6-hydroxymethyldihydropteridine diphosphokinase [Ignavibacteria bacterium]|nr:2-amino-4-hydroxy-6-hydroxymethyldihydropteridine diphosphokinase [Candidatus Gracilibacteria bacterium]
MTPDVFLGLGSNINDRLKYLETAASLIGSCSNIQTVCVSSVYETEPWGVKEQNKFLNMVLKVNSHFTPDELMVFVKDIEMKAGRKVRKKWFEREIDIDILFFGNKVLENDILSIPHKEVQNRRFVLVPMCEISESFVHPVLNKTMSELLELTKDISEVSIYKI